MPITQPLEWHVKRLLCPKICEERGVTLKITGIIHRLLSVVEKGDVTPIEVQIQMRQFVNECEPGIIHAIMTEG
jgi:hypothetical protein